MTEAFKGAPNSGEPRIRYLSREIDPQEVDLLHKMANYMGVELYRDMPAFQGGGILGLPESASQKPNGENAKDPRAKATVLGRSKGSSEPNVVVHFPTNKEHTHFGANYYAYQAKIGDYLRARWKPEEYGLNPLQGVFGNVKIDDGRFLTATRYRPNFEPIGTRGQNGIHELDSKRISPEETRQLVRVLNEMHVDAKTFVAWTKETINEVPPESWLSPKNPNYAFRGKEWWISPTGGDDRMKELTGCVTGLEPMFASIDARFNPAKAVSDMIRNNIELFPHRNGTIDDENLIGETVVVHGSLHPDNIHIKHDPDGKIHFSVSGGDRAQGLGLKGQMIDWLVTSTAGSPEHQQAILDEFFRLHPSDKDRRGLAMHVLYRSILESQWFLDRKKMKEADNLVRLSYDILNGNGIWTGVNTPLKALHGTMPQ